MSNLSAFLSPVKLPERKEVVISKRFCGEDGKPIPFVIRPVSEEENEKLINKSTRRVKVNGQLQERLDAGEYGRRVVVAATVEPDFTSEEMCKAYGTLDPLEVPGKMLLVGEYRKLSNAILELSGLDDDLEEQAKN